MGRKKGGQKPQDDGKQSGSGPPQPSQETTPISQPTIPPTQSEVQPSSSQQPSATQVQPSASTTQQLEPKKGKRKGKQTSSDLPIEKMSSLSIEDTESRGQKPQDDGKQSGSGPPQPSQKTTPISQPTSPASQSTATVPQQPSDQVGQKHKSKPQPSKAEPQSSSSQQPSATQVQASASTMQQLEPKKGKRKGKQTSSDLPIEQQTETKEDGTISKQPSGSAPTEQSSEGDKKKSKGKKKPPPAESTLAPGAKEKSASQPGSTVESSQPEDTMSGKKALKELMKSGDGKVWQIRKRKTPTILHNPKYIARKLTIEVNYCPINFKNAKLKIFHYDVDFKPALPKYLLREALRQMQRKYFPNRHPAFDGLKNLYVAGTKLNFPQGDTVRDTVTVHNPERTKDKEFDVTIKHVNQDLNLSSLFEYMSRGKTSDIPQDVIQGVDIALRSNLAYRFVPAGRSFFSEPTERMVPIPLGDGMELWHGFYQSAIMAWKPYLNVDVANKGFPTAQPVLSYLKKELKLSEKDLESGLRPQEISTLMRFLKGLKVDYQIPNNPATKRTYKVIGLGRDALSHRFLIKEEGKEKSVMEYFDKDKRYRLRFSKLPLIQVGSPQKEVMLPLELCRITSSQAINRKLNEQQTSQMVRNAATPTFTRKERIKENISKAGYNNDPVLKEFDITVDTNFEKVDALVLHPPEIGYNDQRTARVNKGVWRQDQLKFYNSPGLDKWAVINTDSRCTRGRDMVKFLTEQGKVMGINVQNPIGSEIFINKPNQNVIEKHLSDLKGKVRIVVVIMSSYPNDLYNCIKRASEFKTGVLTQCIKANTVMRINQMTAGNLLLKINAKISGTNHIIPPKMMPRILNTPCMIIGADVTHPSPGTENFPSIAAVSASHDRWGFQYNMLYSIQPSRMEMIADLEEMVKTQLQFFNQKTQRDPQRLLYFRDGVSEGQFQQLLSVEMQAIRNACLKYKANYTPPITIVVVQKRHHTRFFPSQSDVRDDRNCNTPSGTLVDTKITHPTELDFYLVSHQSIQGTARPTKYHLLWDDNDFGDEELQVLTFYLCFMFSRCTRAVSYPAPTYYAHLAAFRARAWYEGLDIKYSTLKDLKDFKKKQADVGSINDQIVTNSPMFFV